MKIVELINNGWSVKIFHQIIEITLENDNRDFVSRIFWEIYHPKIYHPSNNMKQKFRCECDGHKTAEEAISDLENVLIK